MNGAAGDGAIVSAVGEPSFGRWLRRSRELRGLTLDEVIAETRLPARVVAALEADDTGAMPDRAYALQYVRAVSLAIGLDPEDVALRYEEWLGTLPPTTLPPPPVVPSTPGEKAVAGAKKLASLPRRISSDPLVWTVLVITAIALYFVLRRR
ncbi:MAG: helix-turn-helix domain-containing protein [Deltaproteobacteria bacterium]|nr:helix-turn-helix domain-containing protein [Deltaproteobacteria bacterium]